MCGFPHESHGNDTLLRVAVYTNFFRRSATNLQIMLAPEEVFKHTYPHTPFPSCALVHSFDHPSSLCLRRRSRTCFVIFIRFTPPSRSQHHSFTTSVSCFAILCDRSRCISLPLRSDPPFVNSRSTFTIFLFLFAITLLTLRDRQEKFDFTQAT